MSQPKGISSDDLQKLQREHPNLDPLPNKLGLRTTLGNIEEIEERRFPWLKARRSRRRTQNPE